MRLTRIVILSTVGLLLEAGSSRAVVRPFVYGDLRWTPTQTQELDYFAPNSRPPDWTITVPWKAMPSWEAGGGVRFYSRFNPDGSPLVGDPRWELRVRFGLGRGSLPGKLIHGDVGGLSGQPAPFTSQETYKDTNWTLGADLCFRLLWRAGIFFGPVFQSITTSGDRNWIGPTTDPSSGDATDQSTLRYSMVELGARVKPLAAPLTLEAYWVPKRFQLSTTHILQSTNWQTATFPSFEHTLGFRVSLDF